MTTKQETIDTLLWQTPGSGALDTYASLYFVTGNERFTGFEAYLALAFCAAMIEAGDWPAGVRS